MWVVERSLIVAPIETGYDLLMRRAYGYEREVSISMMSGRFRQ